VKLGLSTLVTAGFNHYHNNGMLTEMNALATSIHPMTFGPANRKLFGIFHPSLHEPSSRSAVVLCNPFGQEAIRAHRCLRALAERLSREGHAVLRFDYFGTGDSAGDDLDCDLDGWCHDLLTAHQEACFRSGASRIVWVGMRLGGTVAMHAARMAAPQNLARLILWDPIFDGPRYLAYLREQHIELLIRAFDLPQTPSPRDLARDPIQFRDEAIGFALSDTFRTQLEAIRADAFRWPDLPRDLVVVTDPGRNDGTNIEAARPRDPEGVTSHVVRHGINWSTDSAANTALVPAAALALITKLAGEAR
jgi:pimeloyl-ACP methyl ester carboxylesterase